ncbi:MAG: AAA family ATPase [Bacteroidia bacterium]|nr:AAA family ATPase [Bacteroidia bacterium]
MKIKAINIKNYKSIKEISILEPEPFTVFVGPNAAGKSNIFEALEFYTTFSKSISNHIVRLFGEINNFNLPKQNERSEHFFEIDFQTFASNVNLSLNIETDDDASIIPNKYVAPYLIVGDKNYWQNESYIQFYNSFSRIFVGNEKIQKFAFNDDKRLSLSCSNLEQVLKRIMADKDKKAEITEWLEVLIPGFKNIEVVTEELSGSSNLLIYEQSIKKPLTKRLISDGTFNIIALLTALYQSNEPQFLCIEEPENGLNPKVVRELVSIFRQQCKEKGHYIWLNTHSQSIVSELNSNEIVLVDKVNGETKVKQIKGMDLQGMKMDEALLTNSIGGGIPW